MFGALFVLCFITVITVLVTRGLFSFVFYIKSPEKPRTKQINTSGWYKMYVCYFYRCYVSSTNWPTDRWNSQQWNRRWECNTTRIDKQQHSKCTGLWISVSCFIMLYLFGFSFFFTQACNLIQWENILRWRAILCLIFSYITWF